MTPAELDAAKRRLAALWNLLTGPWTGTPRPKNIVFLMWGVLLFVGFIMWIPPTTDGAHEVLFCAAAFYPALATLIGLNRLTILARGKRASAALQRMEREGRLAE